MPSNVTQSFGVWEDSGGHFFARIYGNAGTAITQASITAITVTLWNIDDEDAPAAIGTSFTLTVASVVYDTLQTSDPRWTKDSTGYNFYWPAEASRFPGACKCRVEIKFDPASGEDFHVVWEGTVKALHAS